MFCSADEPLTWLCRWILKKDGGPGHMSNPKDKNDVRHCEPLPAHGENNLPPWIEDLL